VLFALAALLTWIPRGSHVVETYSISGIPLVAGHVQITPHVLWSPNSAMAIYGVVIAALVLVLVGRLRRVGLVAFVLATCALLFAEGLNMKAYDRLLFWQAVMLFASPGAGSGRHEGSPAARYALLLAYCGLYGSTGWNKILSEPRWWTGAVLQYDFVHRNFGGLPLGVWLSDKPLLVAPMSWATLIWEGGFPVLIWVRRLAPWLLLVGAVFHAVILFTLHANTFSVVAVAAYPALLSATQFDRLEGQIRRWVGRRWTTMAQ
jgi:hypothetical protein